MGDCAVLKMKTVRIYRKMDWSGTIILEPVFTVFSGITIFALGLSYLCFLSKSTMKLMKHQRESVKIKQMPLLNEIGLLCVYGYFSFFYVVWFLYGNKKLGMSGVSIFQILINIGDRETYTIFFVYVKISEIVVILASVLVSLYQLLLILECIYNSLNKLFREFHQSVVTKVCRISLDSNV